MPKKTSLSVWRERCLFLLSERGAGMQKNSLAPKRQYIALLLFSCNLAVDISQLGVQTVVCGQNTLYTVNTRG